jgi:hypothetical protein
VETKVGGKFALDNLRMRDYLIEAGIDYADHVKLEHFYLTYICYDVSFF